MKHSYPDLQPSFETKWILRKFLFATSIAQLCDMANASSISSRLKDPSEHNMKANKHWIPSFLLLQKAVSDDEKVNKFMWSDLWAKTHLLGGGYRELCESFRILRQRGPQCRYLCWSVCFSEPRAHQQRANSEGISISADQTTGAPPERSTTAKREQRKLIQTDEAFHCTRHLFTVDIKSKSIE